jgi:uncharacterized protein (DUF4415 family)
LAKVDAHVIQPHEYDEAPEWTDEQIAAADVYQGGKLIRRGGRPKAERPRKAVSIRLPQDVLDHFRATGPGWQSRITEVLERSVRARRAK